MDALETFIINNVEVKVYQDEDLMESPRDWDNLGTMTCFHNRYNLGDSEHEFIHDMYFDKDYQNWYPYDDDAHDFVLWLQKNKNKILCLPLYLYDHSGITMSTGRFRDSWDSGQVGYIYATKEKIRKEFGWKIITKKRKEQILNYLRNEVKVYDQYLTGEVYGFQATCLTCGQELDSCWGFYDDWYKGFPQIKSEVHNIQCEDCLENTQQLFAHTMELVE